MSVFDSPMAHNIRGAHLTSTKFGLSFDHYQIHFGLFILPTFIHFQIYLESKKISNDQELIQSDPTSCPQKQNGNN